MKKFGKGIVKMRIPIVILSILLLIPSVFGFIMTRVNYDILNYLPSDLETMKGQDVLMEEFGKGAYSILICNGMEQKEVSELKKKVAEVDHVAEVLWHDTVLDISVPKEVLPEEIRNVLYAPDDSGTLMFIFYDTTTSADETLQAVRDIRKIADERCFLSGMSSLCEDTRLLINEEMPWYIFIAGGLTMIILAMTLDCLLVGILILVNIGMAILFNLGTNMIQGEISFLTMALVAVLQLGVTMDYSIFLYSSYKEQKEKGHDSKEAMAVAISETIVAVTGSSLTTIAGFIALCFMSFTLGLDLGIVMAKGVLIGVVSCVTVLPCLILLFDKQIAKRAHKTVSLPKEKITAFVLKHYKLISIVMMILWIPALYGNNHYEVYYKLDATLPDKMGCVQANEALKKFDMSTVSMVLVDSDLSNKDMRSLISEIQNTEGVNFCIGMDSVVGSLVPSTLIPEDVTEILKSENWQLLMVSSAYEMATDEVNEQCDVISSIVKKYDSEGMLIGETACTKDLIDITDKDFKVVSLVSIGAIFLLIAIVLKSISLPFILVFVIELAIYINMGMSFYIGETLPFIASVCVGTIQLGATVDYAILMTTRYKSERIAGKDKKEASSIALSTSMHSIMTSAMGFCAATAGVGLYSSADLVGALCILLGRGAIISMVVVIALLPSMYMVFDGLICKTTAGMKVRENG